MRRLFPTALRLAAMAAVAATGLLAARGFAETSAAPKLGFPLACALGKTCWIQHYVDRDPSPAARDYTCGTLTYDGHKGTDIRIADMTAERAGVDVLAAADGKVLRTRDGVADVSVRAAGLQSVKDIECGNGVFIDHGGGWQTQYCHMAKGSLVVHAGQMVKAGQALGHVGLSGETEFPHLHFSVWRNGKIVDPFAPDAGEGKACGGGASLWTQTPPYMPRAVINVGFAPGPVDMAAIEAGNVARPNAAAPYLVAYVRAIGLKAGDEPSLVLSAPNGRTLAPSTPGTLTANSAQRFLFVGKRRPAEGWGTGVYRARYTVRAGGKIVLQRDFDTILKSE